MDWLFVGIDGLTIAYIMIKILREIHSDSNNTLSSFRVWASVGLICGCAVMVTQAFGYGCEISFSGPLTALFAGIFGGKAWQKQGESK